MPDQPTGEEMLERFKATLGRVLQVSKDDVLKMEKAQKAKRRRQRTPTAPRCRRSPRIDQERAPLPA